MLPWCCLAFFGTWFDFKAGRATSCLIMMGLLFKVLQILILNNKFDINVNEMKMKMNNNRL